MSSRFALCFLALVVPITSAHAADFVLTRKLHTDGYKLGPNAVAAKEMTQTIWVGKDRMRVDESEKVTLIRLDLQKLYMVDNAAKTVSVVDLPVDMKKLLPPAALPMIEQMAARMKVTVTPSDETKKIKDWNAHKNTLEIGASSALHSEIWTTKDVKIDPSAYGQLMSAIMSLNPAGSGMADAMKKLDGVPVLEERTQTMGGSEVHARDELVSVESKEPADGLYDPPKDYVTKPFDPMADVMKAMNAGHAPTGTHQPGAKPPVGKPGDKSTEKPAEKPPAKPAPSGGG